MKNSGIYVRQKNNSDHWWNLESQFQPIVMHLSRHQPFEMQPSFWNAAECAHSNCPGFEWAELPYQNTQKYLEFDVLMLVIIFLFRLYVLHQRGIVMKETDMSAY